MYTCTLLHIYSPTCTYTSTLTCMHPIHMYISALHTCRLLSTYMYSTISTSIYVHTLTHLYTHTPIPTRIPSFSYIHVCTHQLSPVYTHTYFHLCILKHAHTSNTCQTSSTYTHIHPYTHLNAHPNRHTHVYS